MQFKHLGKLCLVFMVCVTGFFSCNDERFIPIEDDGAAPGPVYDVRVENLAGGAKISYALPDDKNLLYIKAVYTLKSGQVESKASYLTNNIVLEGFGDEAEREVTLYAVSRSEKLSAPIKVNIKPLQAPVFTVFESLGINETFGGIVVDFENPTAVSGSVNSNMVIGTLRWDEQLKEWVQIDTYYSGLTKDQFAVRGLDSKPYKFGIFIKDRWDNHSDTLETELTPIYEEEIDKKKFKDIRTKYAVPQVGALPISGNRMVEGVDYSTAYPIPNLWDGNVANFFHTKSGFELPIWIPFDLGVSVKLSRYKIWQRAVAGGYFSHGNPHEWEIWGTNTPENPNSWVIIAHQEMIKPSGLPVGQNSADDRTIGAAGQEYNFNIDAPAVRYLAWKHIDNWASIRGEFGFLHVNELSLWGQPAK
ncbi:DUF5000 domain-containing lipoprotein [Pedobacter metabolipauper]|uniref:Uncharacterized protein DUF5126 n=1 Tax=Pedobacter metabolipauper TaxID=425513 RepID=A0A4R6SZJ3_9SPHI|nr:DUF5000 domain-containing lipoprotein [Pedobacter metabolipauper]TDQ11512.1 uncharacterized protein DUF5126 [Pedobacter metabolipauper]